MVPRSLHSAAGAPNYGAEEKAGRSGRDDGKSKKSQETPRAQAEACATGADLKIGDYNRKLVDY